jgi:hypothetical protein
MLLGPVYWVTPLDVLHGSRLDPNYLRAVSTKCMLECGDSIRRCGGVSLWLECSEHVTYC